MVTYLEAKWRLLHPSASFSVGLHPVYLVSHSTHVTCPLTVASCRAVYPTHDFLFRFLTPCIFKNLRIKTEPRVNAEKNLKFVFIFFFLNLKKLYFGWVLLRSIGIECVRFWIHTFLIFFSYWSHCEPNTIKKNILNSHAPIILLWD